MLTRSQVRAILDKTEVFQDGHFALEDGWHTAQATHCLRVLQHPEYATSLAATLGAAYRAQRPQVVLAAAGPGALLGLELARAARARLVLTSVRDGRWQVTPGQAILPGDRAVLCEAQLTDRSDLVGWAQLVQDAGGQVTGCATIIDRTTLPWPHAWPLESLVRPDVPLVAADACPQCQAGEPLTPARATVLL